MQLFANISDYFQALASAFCSRHPSVHENSLTSHRKKYIGPEEHFIVHPQERESIIGFVMIRESGSRV
jgi:hypothetical protein